MANPYQPGPIAGGVERLVGALMGGDEVEAAAKQAATMKLLQQQSAEATIDKKITDALMERDKRQAQQSYEAELTPMLGAEGARIASALMIGGNGSHIENVQKFGLRNDAYAAAQADPNVSDMNAPLVALQGKPIDAAKIQGGHIMRNLLGDAPIIAPTEKESATIETQNARTGLVGAQTENAQARTALVRDKAENPGRHRASGKGKADLIGHPGSGLKPDAQDMIDFATDPKGLKDSFIEAFGYDAYLSALQSVPTLKPHVFRKKPTANDTAALRDRKIAPEDFIKQFGQAAYDAAADSFKAAKQQKKDAK